MRLDWMLGQHRLESIYPSARHPLKSDGEAIAIRLDGKMLLFIEDSNDGYRSSMGEVFVAENADYWFDGEVSIGRDVLVSRRTKGEFSGKDDVYEFRDAQTGKLGLEIGTSNVDDYYPSFVAHYHAEAWGER